MSLTQIAFIVLATLSVVSAVGVIVSKSPISSILWLIVCFFTISGHYLLLNAQFLAIVNIIVYAGAIMVLFLFVVMLMNLNKNTEPVKNFKIKMAGILSGGLLMLVLVAAVVKSNMNGGLNTTDTSGLIKSLGNTLFSDYVLPFELSSVLFLSAMIGAVVIGKKDTTSSSTLQTTKK